MNGNNYKKPEKKIIVERFQQISDYTRQTRSVVDYFEYMGFNVSGKRSIPCPFHEDADPSMNIDPTMNVFHCFSCDRRGSYLQLRYYWEHRELESQILPIIASVAEDILAEDDELKRTLGFSTIYLVNEDKVTVEFNEDGSLKLASAVRFTPHIVDTITIKHICDKIKGNPDKICDFIADVQNDVPFGVLKERYYYGNAAGNISLNRTQVNAMKDELASIWNEMNEGASE